MAVDEAAYRRSIRNKEAQKQQLEQKNRVLHNELERLKDARHQVKRLKNDYEEISREVKKTVNGDHEWEGQRYDKGKRLMNNIVDEDNKAIKAIDNALDALERDIANTQNAIIGNDTLIQKLVSAINSLLHELSALLN